MFSMERKIFVAHFRPKCRHVASPLNGSIFVFMDDQATVVCKQSSSLLYFSHDISLVKLMFEDL